MSETYNPLPQAIWGCTVGANLRAAPAGSSAEGLEHEAAMAAAHRAGSGAPRHPTDISDCAEHADGLAAVMVHGHARLRSHNEHKVVLGSFVPADQQS
jgi:hypothetical protein